MGNSSSSSGRGHHDDTVDCGSLFPQGVYTGPQDWDQSIVSHLIVARKLAPFYRPLEEYDDSWDDEQILAAKKELPDPDSLESVTHANKSKRPGVLKESAKPEAHIYRGAVECPICFLYYPPNINHSRCCDQAICTECFVQIKRNEPTTTHLVSEPAACPYCVQDNFGIVYTPPPWRTGLGSEGSNVPWSDPQRRPTSTDSSPPLPLTHKRRQKSFGADSPEVTTTDQIRPDWEAKLESVRAAVARRANRRIIMRQVGDRLIPVGVTSGRVQVLSSEEAAAAATDGGSRRNRRRQNQQNGAIDQYVGMAGQDLEELMLMEAMRLSLLDHEEHQRKEAEEKKKQEAAAASATAAATGMIQGSDPAGPGPSTLEGRQSLFDTSGSLSSASSISPSASPSIPTHTTVGSQDSLTPNNKRTWSNSRCRTPPPPPSSAGPSSPAAFFAATTSSNGHERWTSRSITPEPGNRNPFQPSGARRVSLDNSMPIITLSNDKTITPRVPDENNNIKPSVPFSNVNLLDQQTPSTSQITTSTSTSTTNELVPGGYLHLSRPHLPSLDFEVNDDSSKSSGSDILILIHRSSLPSNALGTLQLSTTQCIRHLLIYVCNASISMTSRPCPLILSNKPIPRTFFLCSLTNWIYFMIRVCAPHAFCCNTSSPHTPLHGISFQQPIYIHFFTTTSPLL